MERKRVIHTPLLSESYSVNSFGTGERSWSPTVLDRVTQQINASSSIGDCDDFIAGLFES